MKRYKFYRFNDVRSLLSFELTVNGLIFLLFISDFVLYHRSVIDMDEELRPFLLIWVIILGMFIQLFIYIRRSVKHEVLKDISLKHRRILRLTWTLSLIICGFYLASKFVPIFQSDYWSFYLFLYMSLFLVEKAVFISFFSLSLKPKLPIYPDTRRSFKRLLINRYASIILLLAIHFTIDNNEPLILGLNFGMIAIINYGLLSLFFFYWLKGKFIPYSTALMDELSKLPRFDPIREKYALTSAETTVLSLGMDGCTTKVIAFKLGISKNSVNKLFSSIYKKTGIPKRKELKDAINLLLSKS